MTKHIYIYSPSGAVRDKAAFRRGVKFLQKLGHCVEVDEAALAGHQRFAGDDSTRLAGIHRAAQSGADVALMSRGGYGLTRLLADIDYSLVTTAIERGTRFIGMSDFTAFQSAVLAKTGAITWAGPALCEGFGPGGRPKAGDGHGDAVVPAPDEIMLACFDDLLCGQGEGTGWRQNAAPKAAGSAAVTQQEYVLEDALLWGGNLSMLTSLLGTAYFPQVTSGVLFLEDVAEHPYRIERMLTQLLHAGVLGSQRAIVLGQFTGYKLTPHDRGYRMQSVIAWLRSKLATPVLTNLPYGHVATKVLLPVGAKVDLVVKGRDAMILWGHL